MPYIPPVSPPVVYADGFKSFIVGSDLNLALPLYGISLPFSAVVPPDTIFAGRVRDPLNQRVVTFRAGPGGLERSVGFGATGMSPFAVIAGDVTYLEYQWLGDVPLGHSMFGLLGFGVPTEQTIAFYGGFTTPVGSGPVAGTFSYTGGTIAVEERAGVDYLLLGAVHLEADFHANRIFGVIGDLAVYDDNVNFVGDYDYRFILKDVSIQNWAGARKFSGNLVAQKLDDASKATSVTTIISGRFFGDSALEPSGVWQSDAVAGRRTWGSFAGTTVPIGGVATFVQSVGVEFEMPDRVALELNDATRVVTAIPGPLVLHKVTPLPGGGLSFSVPALGTFNPPGSSTIPALDSQQWPIPMDDLWVLNGITTDPNTPSNVKVFERGTLAYSRFGSWTDASRMPAAQVQEISFFAAGVQTPLQAMPSTGTARYAGTTMGMVVDALNNNFPYYGRVNLVADFGAQSVSGSIHSLMPPGGMVSSPVVAINLQTAVMPLVSDTAYSGIASAVDANAAVIGTGTWNGRFYGPAGSEVAGTYSLIDGGNAVRVWGSYGAGR